jgi:hypothetical protein
MWSSWTVLGSISQHIAQRKPCADASSNLSHPATRRRLLLPFSTALPFVSLLSLVFVPVLAIARPWRALAIHART